MPSPARVYVPWTVTGYPNGVHPLLGPLLEAGGEDVCFVGPRKERTIEEARAVAALFARTAEETAARFCGHPVVTRADVVEFVRARNVSVQLGEPEDADLVFHHTVPWTVGWTPWVLHIEMPTLTFFPHLDHGKNDGRPLRAVPAYWLVRDLLEAPACRAVFTHVRATRDGLGPLFDSPIIDAKTRFVSCGPRLSAEDAIRLEAGFVARATSPHVTILFTNSWHQQEDGFFLRGGADLVAAFFTLKERFPSLRLVLRTALPAALGNDTIARLRADPAVTVLDHLVSEAEMIGLYAAADIFALPSAGFHCLSILRAFHAGAACVVSDAPGYEEFVEDGVTGVVVPGRRAAVYGLDPETGWLWDNYAPMFRPDPAAVDRLVRILGDLCRNPGRRRAIAAAARNRARLFYTFDAWAAGTREVLHSALFAPPLSRQDFRAGPSERERANMRRDEP